MLQSALNFLLYSTLVSFLLSFFIIELLYRFNIRRREENDDSIQKIEARKSKVGVPIMGGLIIIISIIYITFVYNYSRSETLLPLFMLIIGALLGALDDLMNIFGRKRSSRGLRHHIKLILNHASILKRIYFVLLLPWTLYTNIFKFLGSRVGSGLYPHEKLLVQTIAGIVLGNWVYFKLGYSNLWLPLGLTVNIHWFIIPFIVLLVIGTANAVNITDGMDGLSSGVLLSSFIAYMVIALSMGLSGIANLCATTIGALIAFLYFNIKPARVQMGDVGSLALGTMLATIAILLHREILLLFIGGVFVIECLSVIIQVTAKRFKKRVFRMAPLHHHFEMLGWSEEKTIMRFWLASIFCAILGIWISTF